MDDFRPHLLIPDPEVDYLDPKPTRGSKKADVDHFQHGSILSAGLQEIISAYTRFQNSDSLRDEDILVFEVHYPQLKGKSKKHKKEIKFRTKYHLTK